MNELQLLIDLHKDGQRQGPGSDADTKRALELAGIDHSRTLKVADIGCGTGSSAILLAQELNAEIIAVDFLPEFLNELQIRAEKAGVDNKITPLNCSMDSLQFSDDEFDLIWSEGAIYNIGFEAGIASWKRFLKPGGKLVVSEITWLTETRPLDLQSFWEGEYTEIDVASAKIKILERHGFSPEAYFSLPENCWLNNYYQPLQKRFDTFLKKHNQTKQAKSLVKEHLEEIALYEKYSKYYSYGVYIATKL